MDLRWLLRPYAVAALAVLGASGSAAQSSVVRDSLGVRIVERATPVWTTESALRLELRPELMLGSSFGAPDGRIGGVIAATRLSDGRIAVADGKAGAIKVFDAEGHVVRRFVPPTGPGAFDDGGSMLRGSGDTLVVFDMDKHRAVSLTADGKTVGALQVDHPPGIHEQGFDWISSLRPLSVLPDDGLIGWSAIWRYRPENARHAESLYAWRALPNGSLDPIATLPSADAYSFAYPAARGPIMEEGLLPFTVRSSVAAGPRGLWYTDGRHFEIREYNLDGTLRQVGRLQRTPATVTSDDMAAFRAEQLTRTNRWVDRSDIQAKLAWLTYPERHAAFKQLAVSRDGDVWAREDGDSTAVQRWDVFDSTARWLGEVDVPAGVDVLEIDADYLLGRTRDPDGWTEHVVLYHFAPVNSRLP